MNAPPSDSASADPRIVSPTPTVEADPAVFDPLRLCIFATVALLGWVLGPLALLVFAALGFSGYRKARQAGLTRSKCLLRDTRLVLAYLGALVVAALVGLSRWVGVW